MATLERFLQAQQGDYERALAEIRNGKKRSHWMWYIFPQIAGLGFSETASFYAISDLQEATDYLNHPILGKRLVDIASVLLAIEHKTATQIFGTPDDLKLRSSMTLFSLVTHADPVFTTVLTMYFDGQPDPKTLSIVYG